MKLSFRRLIFAGMLTALSAPISFTFAQERYRYELAPETSVRTAEEPLDGSVLATPSDGEPLEFGAEEFETALQAPMPYAEGAAAPPVKPAPAPKSDAEKAKAAKAAKKKAADHKKAVNGAYKGGFYDNNYAYINSPLYKQKFAGDSLKQIKFGESVVTDIGGQYRARYHGERNHRGVGLTGRDDDFLLHRTRLFANTKLGDNWRVYGEFIDAESNYENFAPRGIEVNRADMQNLFVDWRFFDGEQGDLTARVGRQELLFGSQRLVSPLDWANTRRNFEGLNILWRGENWNIDTFFLEPVATDNKHFDSAIDEQEFFGMFATYKKIKDQTIDLYGFQYNNASAPQNYQLTTTGGRWQGTKGPWLWELEGAVQFGENTDGSDHSSGFYSAGMGHKWAEHDWKPTLWAYYDWASGDNSRGAGNGFNHLFPLGHKYLGFMDLFGRSNIETPNVQLSFQPKEKLTVLLWYYYFFLQNGADTPYNINMTPFNRPNAPASRDLGHELDLIFNYTINPRMDLMFGYSHFFAGDYYKDTAGVPYRGDADFYYMQYQWNF